MAGLRELGVFGLTIGEEYGGLGEPLLTYALVAEEIARGWMSVSGIINTHFIVSYLISAMAPTSRRPASCREWRRARYGRPSPCPSPASGPDVAAIRTAARPDGEDYLISGQKMWLTNGASSNLVALLARTPGDAARPHASLTAFLIEKDSGFGTTRPGLTIPGKIESARSR